MTKIKITKEKDDPICPRASIGGTEKVGFYCVFRGDKNDEIIPMLEKVIHALKKGGQ